MAVEEGAAADGQEEVKGQEGCDIFYVSRKTLESVKEKLKNSQDITKEDMEALTFPEHLADEEMMVPVDMNGVGDDYDDVEQMVSKLGPKGAAEAFVKAEEHFAKSAETMPEDERPKPLSAKEWRAILEEEDHMEGEEEELLEGEEEEDLDEEEAEEEDEGDEGGDEPATKKAKKG
eukprot:CAMPEP_0170618402 /NCGR_PEP_ID=MMETSP0224-20130122/26942_1 /TAXON_ID=285029 /ORGANISM="Togula jolla, Strain CCCM 725" /LENGTH=175 /DNA_ID=CAMNT_0010944379 /DNA_START=48 /DNA_END=575 /DNA_ORIENTATION=-